MTLWSKVQKKHFYITMVKVWSICACVTRNYLLTHLFADYIHITYHFLTWYQLQIYIEDIIEGSIDDVINMVTWLFLEVLSGVQLHTWNVTLHTSQKVKVSEVINLSKRQYVIDRSKHVFRKKSRDLLSREILKQYIVTNNIVIWGCADGSHFNQKGVKMLLVKPWSEFQNLTEKFQAVLKMQTICRLNSHQVEYTSSDLQQWGMLINRIVSVGLCFVQVIFVPRCCFIQNWALWSWASKKKHLVGLPGKVSK